MINTDEDALICDLAETYGVFNYKGLPLKTVAALSCGLSEDSRIMRRMAGMSISTNTLLLAMIVDNLRVLAWQNTADGQKGKNVPDSIARKLLGEEDRTKNGNFEVYASGEDFDAAWKAIIGE